MTLPIERRPSRRGVTWLTVIGILLLPALLGGLLVAALHNPTERLGNMTAAIVNDDEPVTVQDQYTPLGRQLAAGLVEGSDEVDSNLDWVLSNDEDATEGLEDGTYQAVITIPKEFSAAATSSGQALAGDGADPHRATIDVTTAPDALIVDDAITNQIATVATQTLGRTLSEATLENVFVGYNTLGEQLGEAANGATQLADGAREAGSGAGELAGGAGQLADGVTQFGAGAGELAGGAGQLTGGADQLADGVDQLAGGTGELAGGASELAEGADQLSGGVGELAGGADQLRGGIAGLADGARGLTGGADELATGAHQLAGGVGQLADGARASVDGATALQDGVGQLAAGTRESAAGANELAANLRGGADRIEAEGLVPDDLIALAHGSADSSAGAAEGIGAAAERMGGAAESIGGLAATCLTSGASPEFCEQLGAAANEAGQAAQQGGDAAVAGSDAAEQAAYTAGGVDQLAAELPPEIAGQFRQAGDGAAELGTGLTALADGADQSAAGAGELATGLAEWAAGADQSAAGAEELAGGADQLSGGIGELAGGADQLTAGAAGLADGARQASGGASELAGGAGQLADGATALADGAGQTAAGADQLASGTTELANGARQLADGAAPLADGANELATGTEQLADGVNELGNGAGSLADGLAQATEQLPSFAGDSAKDLASVVADPVETSGDGLTLFGQTAVPLLAAIALWLGSLGTFIAMRATPADVLTSRRSSIAIAARSFLPTAAIGAGQGVLVALVAQLAAGYDAGAFWGVLGVCALTGVAFTAVLQALVAVLGGGGRWIAALIGAFAVATGIVSTMPPVMRDIAPFLPPGSAREAFVGVVTDAGGVGTAVTGLIVWAVLSFLATTVAIARRRTTSAKALLAATG